MVGRFFAANNAIQQGAITSKGDLSGQSKSGLKLVNLLLFACLCLTMPVLGVMAIARQGAVHQLIDLPEIYLPGHPLPKDVMCHTVGGEHQPRCVVRFLDDELHFTFNITTGLTDQTIIPALKYTLGELMLAWGTPSGVVHTPQTSFIFWGNRSVVLYTDSFRPDSRIQYILYDLEPQPALPWRGFQHLTK